MSNRASVFSAIQNARKDYLFGSPDPQSNARRVDIHRRNANSEFILSRENFINSAGADEGAVADAIKMGLLSVTPTSGRKFIQLG